MAAALATDRPLALGERRKCCPLSSRPSARYLRASALSLHGRCNVGERSYDVHVGDGSNLVGVGHLDFLANADDGSPSVCRAVCQVRRMLWKFMARTTHIRSGKRSVFPGRNLAGADLPENGKIAGFSGPQGDA
jgi:hypothetical protein